MNTSRVVWAFIIAPLSPFALLMLVSWIGGSSAGVGVVVAVGYLPCLLCGAFLVLVLDFLNKLYLPYLVLFGGLSGFLLIVLLYLLFILPFGGGVNTDDLIYSFVGGGSLGLIVSLVFGLIAGVPLRKERKGLHERKGQGVDAL